jgi:hypothetical protein
MRTGSQTGNHNPAGYHYSADHNYPTGNYNPSVYPAVAPGGPDCYSTPGSSPRCP